MIEVFNKVKDTTHPVVVHMRTIKGHGLPVAEQNKERFHWIVPGMLDENNELAEMNFSDAPTYESVTKDFILNKVQQDNTVIAVSAATPGAYGFTKDFRDKLGKNYTDVGIAEEHAVAYASALAKNGAKPILSLLSSFVQRTYDQLSQDLCLNNSPVTMLIYWGGISGADATHLGSFDIPLISNIPNIVYLAPTCKEEYLKMLDWSVQQTQYPVAIRVPSSNLEETGIEDKTDYCVLNRYSLVEEGKKVAIVGLGTFFKLAKEVKDHIKNEMGIDATLINPKFITGLDKDLLNKLKADQSVVITLEDGELNGGFGEKIASFYGNSDMKVLNYGALKEFTDRVPLDELYTRYRLKKELILDDLRAALK